jgi:hypothetical protein
MSTLSLRLPASLHRHLRVLAQREGVSINQLISSAVGEKVAALDTLEYLQERAKRGSRKAFEAVLAKVPDIEPAEFDRLPNQRLQPTKARRRVVKKRSGRARLRG